ncbi:hypothetical protein MHY30_04795 [Microbacterium sp. ACRRU]|jgi:hypothetical protein|uniref:hypothetical protein n=1 Tax=Microbacterium sp. ACRRU TaxID=2918204 RepID=UPI001EF4E078|nr:hypothetical protein [Microbacterium sp. ACRRU]MCG7416821.1 hypothetical protein [Microbacterium sp. ACRRU]
MRGHVAATLIVPAALIVAMVIFCAGGSYFVEYQEWDATTSAFVYRTRPFSGVVLGGSVIVSAAVLFGAALLLLRTGRVHGSPAVDECPERVARFEQLGSSPAPAPLVHDDRGR